MNQIASLLAAVLPSELVFRLHQTVLLCLRTLFAAEGRERDVGYQQQQRKRVEYRQRV